MSTSVIDSRDIDGATIRRRRECDDCNYRFTTYERVEPIKMNVQKKTGLIEPYDRAKLTRGVQLAVEKTSINFDSVETLVDEIEKELFQCCQTAVPSTKIGQAVLKKLKALDEVAYLRFSSVYKEFKTLKSFEKELNKLSGQKSA